MTRNRGLSQFCGISVPAVGSTMHGPVPEAAAVKYVAALAGVAGDPSSGIESMTGADGKSVQLAEQARTSVMQLPGVVPPPGASIASMPVSDGGSLSPESGSTELSGHPPPSVNSPRPC